MIETAASDGCMCMSSTARCKLNHCSVEAIDCAWYLCYGSTGYGFQVWIYGGASCNKLKLPDNIDCR
jgi:hypothetical protein